MSELRWTKDFPTVPGWYWMQHIDEPRMPEIVKVAYNYCGRLCWDGEPLDFTGEDQFEWQGPIEPKE